MFVKVVEVDDTGVVEVVNGAVVVVGPAVIVASVVVAPARRAHLRDFASPRQSRQDKIRAGSRIVKRVIYKEYFGSFHP